jgi:hypothetical protein
MEKRQVWSNNIYSFVVLMGLKQVKMNPLDPTDVQCLDTRETLDCEVVILKDGRGQIVTVT